jgi:citrate lyase subunit beta / citryl-CoA lyase
MSTLPPMRSLMFVPGHRERMIQRALGLGEFGRGALDVAILDLEDGVPAESKDEARRLVADVLGRISSGGAGPARYVRIRRAGGDDGAADLDAIVRPGLDGIMAPKVRGPDEVEWLANALDARERDAKLAHGTVRIIP